VKPTLAFALTATVLAVAQTTPAATIDLLPVADNTLYEVSPDTVITSNGAGQYMFAGNTANGSARRAVVAFDLSVIPAQSTVIDATLRLYMSRSVVGGTVVAAHRLLADWGEGTSDAPNNEGRGAAATPGDATWFHTFFPTSLWSTPGGDFVGTASATQLVDGIGSYSWSGPELRADVQLWVDDSSSNYGWILLGAEQTTPSAKRFGTRENDVEAQRPVLTVEYTGPVATEPVTWGEIKALYR
jgi:hypothetical protein